MTRLINLVLFLFAFLILMKVMSVLDSIVNIGTAQNLFKALKESLSSKGLDFRKCIAFMSDTTNVMKGVRSGVQKLIKYERPNHLDVGCI